MWLLSLHGSVLNSREATQGKPGFGAAASAVMCKYIIILTFINEYVSPWSPRIPEQTLCKRALKEREEQVAQV